VGYISGAESIGVSLTTSS